MRGDLAAARYHAGQMTTETYVYGQLARAVIAGADGNIEEAHRAKRAILALSRPGRTTRAAGSRGLINAPEIVDRLHERSDSNWIPGNNGASNFAPLGHRAVV